MPVARLSSRLFRLAAAALLASALAAPARAQVVFSYVYSGVWDHYMALPVYYAFPYTIGFPGHAAGFSHHVAGGRWLVAAGVRGAAGRLHLP
jgi:hypothetical protein